jgi:DNA replication protein DnaC
LKRIAEQTSVERLSSSSASRADLPGDPNCPYCHGVGYLRADVPPGDPRFGRLEPCVCRMAEISHQVHQRLFALSRLSELSHLRFETFQPQGRGGLSPLQAQSLSAALNQAQQFAQRLEGWLLLMGGYGCGKTHLAAAIANFAVEHGVPTLFLTVPDLLDQLRFAYEAEDTTFEERFEEIRNATLLILDDFGTQNATPWAQEKLFQILNYRYINRLPTVITTNLSLDEIEMRIRSRLQDPELVTRVIIRAPDYRRPTSDMGHPELSSLDLHADQTFETFTLRGEEELDAEARRSLKQALETCQKFARHPQGWLVLTGDYGCGKTHLAAAIANYQARFGDPPLFVMVPDLLDHLRATFSPSSTVTFDRRFEEIRTAPLLILDDLGTQSMTPWVREKLAQLFNYRYDARLPTVITIAADALAELDMRIRSRLLDERLVTTLFISAPPYHARKTTQRKKKKSP